MGQAAPLTPEARIADAIERIAAVPGYTALAAALAEKQRRGQLVFVPTLRDRGIATLLGTIQLGPDGFVGSWLGLAEVLLHELYHTQQNPFLKTASFWAGIATRTPVMQRYERPAYQAGYAFLRTVAAHFPEWADEARQEAESVAASFQYHYSASL